MNHDRGNISLRGRSGAASAGSRPAFTLVELLVASAAVVIIFVGVAQVFRMTGETVASGRRLSAMTTLAATIERQLRTDFAGMTHDGFLMIRHSGADVDGDLRFAPGSVLDGGPDGVPLFAGDPRPRARRTDELTFFAKGDYMSVRDPRHQARTAQAKEARIYYGHAERRSRIGLFEPFISLSDNNSINPATPLGGNVRLGQPGAFNPNQYAADWLLVRHVTLLSEPAVSEQDSLLFDGVLPRSLGGTGANWGDSDYQIGLQPASPSIFRRVTDVFPFPTLAQVARPSLGAAMSAGVEVPYASSGVVDIAATSLAEIRSIVHSAPRPRDLMAALQNLTPEQRQGIPAGATRQFLAKTYRSYIAEAPVAPEVTNDALIRMQEWMMQALPADSDGVGTGGLPDVSLMRRMRAELTPPNYLGWPAPQNQQDYDRADQLALTASVFVPHCTEFIVEWSLGEVDTQAGPGQGRTIWYGLERIVDVARDGAAPATPGSPPGGNQVNYFIRPYMGQTPAGGPLPANHPYFLQKSQTVTRRDGSTFKHPISRYLIHPDPYFIQGFRYNPALPPGSPLYPLYSCFGYVDPTYVPTMPPKRLDFEALSRRQPQDRDTIEDLTKRGYLLVVDRNGDGIYNASPDPAVSDVIKPVLLKDVNHNGQFEATDGDVLLEPETIPWPWPKMVRITMSVADPSDPKVEQTFQFVIDVPPERKGSTY